ncbi:hypothetical protein BS78_04G177800 [Paspalum vaginatum]|nr:hypothetical protein BS78_04G177800 [Paspalum vaginatum]
MTSVNYVHTDKAPTQPLSSSSSCGCCSIYRAPSAECFSHRISNQIASKLSTSSVLSSPILHAYISSHLRRRFHSGKSAMKQKIVLKVEMKCDRCRSKALALAAATGGVDSVALAGGDARDQVVVVGDGVDSIKLATALRKKVGPADILQIGVAEAKEADAGAAGDKNPRAPFASNVNNGLWYYQYPPPQQPVSVAYGQPAVGYAAYGYQTPPDSACSIM